MRKNHMWKAILLVAFVVILVACQGNAEDSNANNGTNSDANGNNEGTEQLEGSVVIDGSGTVYPLMAKLAEEYMVNEQENVSVEVSRAGTSAGFEKFLVENGTDFNDASREIKEEEAAKAEELGIDV